jgi:RNA polymerase sigma factor (sigma-70 family)
MLLKGGIMAQPLKKTYPNGTPYTRPANIEAAIDAALAQDLATQCERALIRNPASPGYLPSESLLHLIRDAHRRRDAKALESLLPLLLARCAANLNSKVDSSLLGAVELRKEILGDFAELIAIDGSPEDTHKLDFYEVRFNSAFALFRKTHVRDELAFQNRHLPTPEISDEAETVEQELDNDFIARLADLQGDAGGPEDRLFRKQVLAAIMKLPPDERTAVVLVHHYGYTRAAAAKLCGVDERTIRNRLDRAYAKLSKLKEDA